MNEAKKIDQAFEEYDVGFGENASRVTLKETITKIISQLEAERDELKTKHESAMALLDQVGRGEKELQALKDAVRDEQEKYIKFCKANGSDSVDMKKIYILWTKWTRARNKLQPLIK